MQPAAPDQPQPEERKGFFNKLKGIFKKKK